MVTESLAATAAYNTGTVAGAVVGGLAIIAVIVYIKSRKPVVIERERALPSIPQTGPAVPNPSFDEANYEEQYRIPTDEGEYDLVPSDPAPGDPAPMDPAPSDPFPSETDPTSGSETDTDEE